MPVTKMCDFLSDISVSRPGFKNGRNYVCERHFEGYFRTISGLKFDGCHHSTLCIIPTVEYVKKKFGLRETKIQKKQFLRAHHEQLILLS